MEESVVDLKNCSSKEDFFNLFEKKLSFPHWWGRNWDAFNDCITDEELSNTKSISKILLINTKKLEDNKLKDYSILKEIIEEFNAQRKD